MLNWAQNSWLVRLSEFLYVKLSFTHCHFLVLVISFVIEHFDNVIEFKDFVHDQNTKKIQGSHCVGI